MSNFGNVTADLYRLQWNSNSDLPNLTGTEQKYICFSGVLVKWPTLQCQQAAPPNTHIQ